MPIYEYRCTKCGRKTETIQKASDRPLKRCEVCSGPLEKLVSRSSFQLKGSGWYVTDYGRGQKGSGEKVADKDDKKDDKKESKKESKSENGKSTAGKGGRSSGASGS